MVKPPKLDEDMFQAIWEALPPSDKRFIDTLVILTEAIGDDRLRYHELPARLERTLQGADRNALFSVIAECLGLLLNAPAMERVKQCHRQRRSVQAASKQNRTERLGRNADDRSIARKRQPK